MALSFETRLGLYRFFQKFQRLFLKTPALLEFYTGADRMLQFLRVWRYISETNTQGDYLEFGVFEGMSFELSLRAASKYFRRGSANRPKFFAFDSFSGLPQPENKKDADTFQKGDYNATLDRFQKNIRSASKGWDVRITPGFYESTLKPELLSELGIKAAAFIHIDCDLQSSALEALRFVTPILQTGTILCFDDWFYSAGHSDRGEAGACNQWLSENPHISLTDFGNIGAMGKLFLIAVS